MADEVEGGRDAASRFSSGLWPSRMIPAETRSRVVRAMLFGVGLGIVLAVAVFLYLSESADSPLPTAPLASAGGPVAAQGPASYAGAVARAAPSVVNIYTTKVRTERQAMMFTDPLLQHHFGGLLPEQTRQRMETSLGSGVIVDSAGYILTNLHILKDADEVKVVLADGSNVPVQAVGEDPETDLAILRMEAGQVPEIAVGDAGALRVGDVVLAIGNPFGVGQTVTMGIVGATGRSHLGISSFENFIQTDAAINPGNSGGALINARGELVGINTAIFSKSGGSHGIGFAIPADLAMKVLDQILHKGRMVRGWIGITARDVTPALQESFALRVAGGVLVSGVLDQGPADRAGLRAGDVITHIANRAVGDVQDMLDAVANAGPGVELVISGWRGNEWFEMPVVTIERPAMPR